MYLNLIPRFKNQLVNHVVLRTAKELARKPGTDCINLKGFSKVTGDKPVYAYVDEKEVVILMLDWNSKPEDELADEDTFDGNAPLYFSAAGKRVSPAWEIAEFTRQYKQSLADAGVEVPLVWSVLMTNANLINYDEMTDIWDMMCVSVYHQYEQADVPEIRFDIRYHAVALRQFKAFRLWCEQQDYLPRDPYAFEDIDADYDEMEYGIDDYDDEEEDDEEDNDNDNDVTDINLDDFPQGSVRLSQNNVVNVEILKPMACPKEELGKLVGCQNIKSQISDLLELTRYNRRMTQMFPDWKQHSVSLHAIFFGRPGTGKTTVCKIYGGLLKEAGVLSKGHVVVCNRATFMGNNWGDEERAIRQVLEMARGGVLMIDEAYLLNSSNPNDPGKLILPQFMDILSNEQQRDVALVLCGYKEPMQKLLNLNPGLASRFPNRFEFEDFTIDELLKITLHRISEHGYHFTRAGLRKYTDVLRQAYAVRDMNTWGNARFVANLLEHIYLLHAKRCMNLRAPRTAKMLFSLTPSDIQSIDVPKAKPKIGF